MNWIRASPETEWSYFAAGDDVNEQFALKTLMQYFIQSCDMELIDIPLFQDMTSLDCNGYNIDLHNDYQCTGIHHDKEAKSFCLLFERTGGNSKNVNMCLVFKEAVVEKINFSLPEVASRRIMDSLYRGRFEKHGRMLQHRAKTSHGVKGGQPTCMES